MKRTKYKLGIVMDPISAIDPKKIAHWQCLLKPLNEIMKSTTWNKMI